MNLKEVIGSRESETTEFKTSLAEWGDVIETISAFSNRNGGRVFIGVADDCGIVGVNIGKKTIEKLANQIKQNTDPVIHPSIRVEEIGGKDGKQVIVVDTIESEPKPVLAFGRAFMRVGKSNQKLGYDDIRNLAIKTSRVYWAMNGRVLPITGDGSETRDWTYVDDIVGGLLAMGVREEAIGEAINLGSGKEQRVVDMARKVNDIAGNEAGIVHVPRRDWDAKTRLLSSIEKAKRLLGYKPQMVFADGLERVHGWFARNWEDVKRSAEF